MYKLQQGSDAGQTGRENKPTAANTNRLPVSSDSRLQEHPSSKSPTPNECR